MYIPTFGVGYIETPYSYLRAVLGEPNKFHGDVYKSDVQWSIFIQSDPIIVAKVYNYKNGKNYLGKEGKEVEQITCWSVGGNHHEKVKDYIYKRLGMHVE